MPYIRRISGLAALALVLTCTPSTASAADRPVGIAGFSFSPTPVMIAIGASVTWTNDDAVPHSTTSDTGVWDSGALGQSGSFTRTFSQPGVFPYHCSIHPSMLGTIIVGNLTYLPLVAQ